MNEENYEMINLDQFDPNARTYRETEWDQPMDEADDYIDWDDVSDADADWRCEAGDLDLWDDEDGLASAGFGMDESYDF